VAAHLRRSGHFGTLLFDLLTPEEDLRYGNRFEIGLLTDRLVAATQTVADDPEALGLPIGYFGASTGAAAALKAAARLPELVTCVVSRGGRPDLAGDALPEVAIPTLLIVDGADDRVLALNRTAFVDLGTATKDLKVVPGATHLFEEPGTIEQVADLTLDWFERHLGAG
jgi:putative phosphoribosyl transferase